MRTFSLSCDLDAAAAELDLPPAEMPGVDEFHPLLAGPGLVVVCVHDDANERTYPIEVPREVVDNVDSSDEVARHLERVVKARFN